MIGRIVAVLFLSLAVINSIYAVDSARYHSRYVSFTNAHVTTPHPLYEARYHHNPTGNAHQCRSKPWLGGECDPNRTGTKEDTGRQFGWSLNWGF